MGGPAYPRRTGAARNGPPVLHRSPRPAYVSYSGNMDLAITIRTMDVCDGRVAVQAGAGIVYDSVPETELEECRNKAGALIEAVAMAEAAAREGRS